MTLKIRVFLLSPDTLNRTKRSLTGL